MSDSFNGETNLSKLLSTMQPALQDGEYVFCSVSSVEQINPQKIIALFREKEGITVIIDKATADELMLSYSFVAAWITLTVHSSLEAVGLTAAFATALSTAGISCNVIAAYYHDHIFVNSKDAAKAMHTLAILSSGIK